jgi:RNA polymerase sigma-70 factor (ECF subfamily)
VRRNLRGHADAEDAVQEILIDLWKNAARFDRNIASESTFVAMIARRRLIDLYRKRRGERENAVSLDELPVAASGEMDRAEIEDEAAHVLRQMERLRPEERTVLELSSLHGLTHPKIAEVTDLPLGTVKTHARRGMQRLRALLKEDQNSPDGGGDP